MGSEFVCGYKLVRQLGARALPSYAAIDPKPRRSDEPLCVVERLARKNASGAVSAEAAAEFLRDAKRLTQLKHPNVVRVREVVLGTSTVLVVMDWIEGEVWSDVQAMAAEQKVPIPLGGSLRVLVDLLEGLSALHEVCDAKRERLNIVHAEVAPQNLVAGLDGRAVLVHPLRAPGAAARTHAPDVAGYLSPEVLLGDQTADQRADVFGVGVMLWEALAGRRMHPAGQDAGEIVMRLLGGKITAPSVPADAPWAAPLVDVVKRAVSPDPSSRFANATEMLAEVRRAAGGRLAPKLTVGALVEAVGGTRIRTRTKALAEARSIIAIDSEAAWTTEAPTVNRIGEAHVTRLLDAESAKPTPMTPPAMPVPLASAGPASSRPKPTLLAKGAQAPIPPQPPSFTPADASDEIEIDVDVPSPPAPEAHAPPPEPRAVAVPPPPLSSRSRFDTATETNTDLAAAVGTAPAPPSRTTKWTIGLAFAAAVVAVSWLALRPSDPAPATGTTSPAASAATSARTDPAPSASPESTPPAPAPAPADSAATPPEAAPYAPADRAPALHPAGPAPAPAIPTVTGAPAPVIAPPSGQTSTPPAASSAHPKKRVYDPMGI